MQRDDPLVDNSSIQLPVSWAASAAALQEHVI
jgi:hypothetical protein